MKKARTSKHSSNHKFSVSFYPNLNTCKLLFGHRACSGKVGGGEAADMQWAFLRILTTGTKKKLMSFLLDMKLSGVHGPSLGPYR